MACTLESLDGVWRCAVALASDLYSILGNGLKRFDDRERSVYLKYKENTTQHKSDFSVGGFVVQRDVSDTIRIDKVEAMKSFVSVYA